MLACLKKQSILVAVLYFLPAAVTGFAQTPAPPADNGEDLIPFLNQTVLWHRQLSVQQQVASEPSDIIFLSDSRRLSDQVVRLSFDFARARAQSLPAQAAGDTVPNQSATASSSQYQRFADFAAKADARVKQSKRELDALRVQLESAPAAKRRALQAAVDETQSELDLFTARRDVMRSVMQVGGSNNAQNTGSILAQIEEMARTVPAASAPSTAEDSAAAANPGGSQALSALTRTSPSGIVALVADLFSLHRKIRALDENQQATADLIKAARSMRAPLVARTRELTQSGDQIAQQAPTQDPAALAQQRKSLDALTAQYKQVAASIVPLARQAILLDVFQRDTANWHATLDSQYRSEIKGLVLRLAGLALVLGLVFVISELWRKATFRYITDIRRRYQFLLLRRIVLWIVVAIIISLALASELGAITTFAGLLTAGIAVALQNVILAVAGYFFLVGKYGVRVGDRIQIGEVVGDVVDIGLVRIHLMEVSHGVLPRPTGRVVVFSNAVVFQAGVGMFKQIPGTSFLWHEVTLTLDQHSDYRQIEQRMMDAVNKVYAEYQDKMETQRRGVERSYNSVSISAFQPESRLLLTTSGLEIVLRYPVEMHNAAEIDDRITRALLDAIEREPKLQKPGSSAPTIKMAEKPA